MVNTAVFEAMMDSNLNCISISGVPIIGNID